MFSNFAVLEKSISFPLVLDMDGVNAILGGYQAFYHVATEEFKDRFVRSHGGMSVGAVGCYWVKESYGFDRNGRVVYEADIGDLIVDNSEGTLWRKKPWGHELNVEKTIDLPVHFKWNKADVMTMNYNRIVLHTIEIRVCRYEEIHDANGYIKANVFCVDGNCDTRRVREDNPLVCVHLFVPRVHSSDCGWRIVSGHLVV